MTLSKTLDRSELISRAVWEAAFSSRFHEPTQLTMLTIWYLELLIEHQSAVTLLIRQHHAGSAMALVRCTFEIMVRGMWAISHMSEADAKEVLDDTFKFPTMAVIRKYRKYRKIQEENTEKITRVPISNLTDRFTLKTLGAAQF